MNPADVLLQLIERGGVLWIEEERLLYRAPAGWLDDTLRQHAAVARPALIALIRAGAVLPRALPEWPERWREEREERAGFLQFESGLSRQEADRESERLVRLEHTRAFVARHAFVVDPPAKAVAAGAGGGPHRR